MTAAKATSTSPRQSKTTQGQGAGPAKTAQAGAGAAPAAAKAAEAATKAESTAKTAERVRAAATAPFAEMFQAMGLPREFAGLGEGFRLNGFGYERFAELGAENMRAVVTAGTIFSKGLEALGNEMSGYAQDALAEGVEAAREFSEIKDFDQLMDRQSAYAKTAYDRMVAETAKLSEMSFRTLRESAKPLSEHVDAATANFIKTLGR